MNTTPTTKELKIQLDLQMQSICQIVDELKTDIKSEFRLLKDDISRNYVRSDIFENTVKGFENELIPIKEFQKTTTGVGIGFVLTLLTGIVGLVLSHVIPGLNL